MAAHRTLPLGTVVRVTNLENGRAVTLRVIDRGPVRPELSARAPSSTCRRALRGGSDSFETGWSACSVEVVPPRGRGNARRLATDGYNERRCQTDRLRSTRRSTHSALPTSATTTRRCSPARMPPRTGPTSRPAGQEPVPAQQEGGPPLSGDPADREGGGSAAAGEGDRRRSIELRVAGAAGRAPGADARVGVAVRVAEQPVALASRSSWTRSCAAPSG